MSSYIVTSPAEATVIPDLHTFGQAKDEARKLGRGSHVYKIHADGRRTELHWGSRSTHKCRLQAPLADGSGFITLWESNLNYQDARQMKKELRSDAVLEILVGGTWQEVRDA